MFKEQALTLHGAAVASWVSHARVTLDAHIGPAWDLVARLAILTDMTKNNPVGVFVLSKGQS